MSFGISNICRFLVLDYTNACHQQNQQGTALLSETSCVIDTTPQALLLRKCSINFSVK